MINNIIIIILFVLLCISIGTSVHFYMLYKKIFDHVFSFVDRVNENNSDDIIAAQTKGYVEATRNLIKMGFL